MNARLARSLLALAFIGLVAAALEATVTATPKGGRLEGTVSFSRGDSGLLVFVTKAPGTFPAPAKHATMDQRRMHFVPHVMPVLVGTTVDFVNSDAINHNVFSPDNEGYNLGSWGKGEKRSYTFKQEGTYTQLCSLHPEMEAFILVLQNPYYATTDKDGHFTIANIPDGHYVLKVWGEKLKSKDKKKTFAVDVKGGTATTTIAL